MYEFLIDVLLRNMCFRISAILCFCSIVFLRFCVSAVSYFCSFVFLQFRVSTNSRINKSTDLPFCFFASASTVEIADQVRNDKKRINSLASLLLTLPRLLDPLLF